MSSLTASQWELLRDEARAAAARAYAPYSKLRVGAAAFTTDGRLVTGANVENASYGLTLCAECSLVSDLNRQGGGRLQAVMVVAGDGAHLTPCGRCRQLLFEHGGRNLEVCGDEPGRSVLLDALIPGAFGPDDLDARSEQ
jgi:cytidine deaminase